MGLADRLDEMRSTLPGCTLVSFGDLRTGLALRTSALRQYKQDYLEGLMQQAAQSFAATDVITPPAENAAGTSVILATPDEYRIFLRSDHCASDVLCCVCDEVGAQPYAEQAAKSIFRFVSEGG